MRVSKSRLRAAILISLGYLLVGNIVGMSTNSYPILEVIFAPYTFIAGMSQFAGWDALSIVLEILVFLVMTAVFYLFAVFIIKEKQ